MPPFRHFLSRKPAANGLEVNDENQKIAEDAPSRPSLTEQRSNPLSIKGDPGQPNEYKMSVVNDSGVYLPPSPPEKKSFWHKSPNTTTTSNHRSVLSENEPFSISRESFESYRRSFDISARSPVLQGDSYPSRTSLDSRSLPRLPRSAINGSTFQKPEPTEEDFEDVGLNDETNKPKKRSFLSRFGENSDSNAPPSPTKTPDPTKPPENKHFGFHVPGRKRGQSGTGNELGHMDRPTSSSIGGKDDSVIR